MAIWAYDKRSVNNADFVYFGMEPLAAGEEHRSGVDVGALVRYAEQVSGALGIVEGPSHLEVKMTSTGPCLVEVGSRCHGGEGTWMPIAEACYAVTQVQATLDAFLDADAFDALPKMPERLSAHGCEVFLVSRESGLLRALPGVDVIKALPSFLRLELLCRAGAFVRRTTDCFTRPGAVQLLHAERQQVEADVRAIRAMELPSGGLFDFTYLCAQPPPGVGGGRGVVVVVDPFSTGAQLAAQVAKRGFGLCMVLAERDSPVAELVVEAVDQRDILASVQHDDAKEDQGAALRETLAQLEALQQPVVAVLPGAETGVLLADRLAEAIGTRGNGTAMSAHRRNKYLMGEAVRAAGLRAVKQLRATEWAAIAAFIAAWRPEPVKVIVKPIESAGTDDVFLCGSLEAVQEAFLSVNGKVNGLGQVNEGVLVQEYLEGPEFVVDHVSRDGAHKCVAAWEYDKRPVNGAPFVYFGMRPRAAGDGAHVDAMIAYARRVLDALQVRHGPSHMEIKLTASGPCLVEVGARIHGGEGTWLPIAEGAFGLTMVDATLDAYLEPDAFDALPDRPLRVLRDGREVDLVSYHSGTVRGCPGVAEITAFESFYRCEMAVQPGSAIVRTVDCFTRPGAVQLTHEDPRQVQKDYERIRELERDGLFDVEGEDGIAAAPQGAK